MRSIAVQCPGIPREISKGRRSSDRGGARRVFVRKRVSKGRAYYAVVESYRGPDGRPRHRQLAALGTSPTVGEALQRLAGAVEEDERRLAGPPGRHPSSS